MRYFANRCSEFFSTFHLFLIPISLDFSFLQGCRVSTFQNHKLHWYKPLHGTIQGYGSYEKKNLLRDIFGQLFCYAVQWREISSFKRRPGFARGVMRNASNWSLFLRNLTQLVSSQSFIIARSECLGRSKQERHFEGCPLQCSHRNALAPSFDFGELKTFLQYSRNYFQPEANSGQIWKPRRIITAQQQTKYLKVVCVII